MLAIQTVHTSGVNWDGILVNAGVITTLVSLIGGFFYKRVKNTYETATERIVERIMDKALAPILEELRSHGERIAYLEGVDSGKKQMTAQAKLTSGP
jgi:hypothetical protein